MIDLDEEALICDFAETYHIYDYRSLPAGTAATLAAGLRDESRIKRRIIQEESGLRVNNTELLLSSLNDRIGALISGLGNGEQLPSLVEQCYDKVLRADDGLQRFKSGEEFEAAKRKLLGENSNGTT